MKRNQEQEGRMKEHYKEKPHKKAKEHEKKKKHHSMKRGKEELIGAFKHMKDHMR